MYGFLLLHNKRYLISFCLEMADFSAEDCDVLFVKKNLEFQSQVTK